MIVYKFRVTFDEPEDVSRDIEIKPAQTFETFHKSILQAIHFDNSGEAVFFTSDDYWRKEVKIPFDQFPGKKISEFIEGPHQKFIYEYSSKTKWTFTVELAKIIEGDPKNEYPRLVKSAGDAPAQYHIINPALILEDLNAAGEGDLEIDDSIFYRNDEETLGLDESEKNSVYQEDEAEDEEAAGEEESEYDDDSFSGEGSYDEDEF
jgi:hypothetical protein